LQAASAPRATMGIFADDPDFIGKVVITVLIVVVLCVVCCVFGLVCGLITMCVRSSTNTTDQEFVLAGGKGHLAKARQQREDAKPSATERLVGVGISAGTGGIL